MLPTYLFFTARLSRFFQMVISFRSSKDRLRRFFCLSLVLILFTVSSPQLAQPLFASALRIVKDTVSPLRLLTHSMRPWSAPAALPRQETLADRIARVSSIQIAPRKFVGYIGETQTFTAVGLDSSGEVVHGVRFDWDTLKDNKVGIDEAGRASFLQPGLTRIICRAGAVGRTRIAFRTILPATYKPSAFWPP
jgi:hypothetical protein